MNELKKIEQAPTINVEGIKSSVQNAQERAEKAVELYSGLTSYEDMKDAKAKLNNLVKDIEETRKGFTRDLDAFKNAVKTTFDDAVSPVKAKADEYKEELDRIDNEAKEEKRELIAQVPNYDEYIQYFEFNPKWLNKSYSITDIQDEIKAGVEQIAKHKETIHNFATAYDLDSQPYMNLLKDTDITDIQAQIKQDHERLSQQEKAKAEQHEEKQVPKPSGKVHTITRTLKGTKEQLEDLKAYADSIGVEWVE